MDYVYTKKEKLKTSRLNLSRFRSFVECFFFFFFKRDINHLEENHRHQEDRDGRQAISPLVAGCSIKLQMGRGPKRLISLALISYLIPAQLGSTLIELWCGVVHLYMSTSETIWHNSNTIINKVLSFHIDERWTNKSPEVVNQMHLGEFWWRLNHCWTFSIIMIPYTLVRPCF